MACLQCRDRCLSILTFLVLSKRFERTRGQTKPRRSSCSLLSSPWSATVRPIIITRILFDIKKDEIAKESYFGLEAIRTRIYSYEPSPKSSVPALPIPSVKSLACIEPVKRIGSISRILGAVPICERRFASEKGKVARAPKCLLNLMHGWASKSRQTWLIVLHSLICTPAALQNDSLIFRPLSVIINYVWGRLFFDMMPSSSH